MTDNFSSHMLGITTGSPYRQTSKTNHKQVAQYPVGPCGIQTQRPAQQRFALLQD